MANKHYQFRLSLPADDYLAYYQQRANQIIVKDIHNRTLQFPAENLRPFLKHKGIYGLFEMECDENNKFLSLREITDQT